MLTQLARNWWVLALRGVIAVLFGLAAFVWPGITLAALVLLFGAYALVDGVFAVIAALTGRSGHERWWVLLLEGLVGVAAGVLTFVWPAITEFVLLYLIAAWAVVTGVIEVIAARSGNNNILFAWSSSAPKSLAFFNPLASVFFVI